jgi:hypothetical protein
VTVMVPTVAVRETISAKSDSARQAAIRLFLERQLRTKSWPQNDELNKM